MRARQLVSFPNKIRIILNSFKLNKTFFSRIFSFTIVADNTCLSLAGKETNRSIVLKTSKHKFRRLKLLCGHLEGLEKKFHHEQTTDSDVTCNSSMSCQVCVNDKQTVNSLSLGKRQSF